VITVLRPLSLSELLDRTFYFYRNHFLLFLGINGIPQLVVLAMLLSGALLLRTHQDTSVVLTLLGYLLFYVAVFVSQAPTIVAVSNLQTQKSASIASSYRGARNASFRVLWIVFLILITISAITLLSGMAFTAVAAAIAASMGTTLAVITSITLLAIGFAVSLYLMLNWSLIIPVTVLEGGWFRVSSRRSRALIQGSRWRVFVIYLLMGLLAGVVTVMLEFLLLFSISLLRIRDYRTVQMIAQVVVAVALFMGISIVGALATISLSLVYFDQRVRKEGFDLQLMMATLQQATPPPPATAPVS
jgi:hypothetical protein